MCRGWRGGEVRCRRGGGGDRGGDDGGKKRVGEAVVLTVLGGKGEEWGDGLPFGLTGEERRRRRNWSDWPILETKGGGDEVE